MTLRRPLLLLFATASALVAGAPAAPADLAPTTSAGGVVVAGPSAATYSYATRVVVLPQGHALRFANGDMLRHTVTADALGPDGRPLFGPAGASPQQTVEVAGASSLPPGTYAFHCSIHATMHGTLVVTG